MEKEIAALKARLATSDERVMELEASKVSDPQIQRSLGSVSYTQLKRSLRSARDTKIYRLLRSLMDPQIERLSRLVIPDKKVFRVSSPRNKGTQKCVPFDKY